MRFVTGLFLLLPLFAQDFTDYKIEKVFVGYRFAEGPSWSPDKYLVFCDVPANHVIKWVSGGKPEMLIDNSGGASGTAFDSQGRLYVAEARARRVIRLDKRGKTDVLAEKFEGKRLNAPNDIVVRRDGNAYFTDPAFGYQSDTRELDYYGVYRITPKGELEVIAKPKGRPNGIAMSHNGRQLYVSNSDEHNIRLYDLDKNGVATNERIAVSNIEGVPDGIRLDEKGNIYVAAAKVLVYSPAGKLIHSLEFSDKPSNLTFGDPDLGTLYITARSTVYRVRFNVKGAAPYQKPPEQPTEQ